MFMNDSGLMASLLQISSTRDTRFTRSFGQLLETHVAMELIKQSGWSEFPYTLYHYRTHAGAEVDFVAETPQGVIGIEVKAAAQVEYKDFRGLRNLSDEVGKKFIRGVVLYTGDTIVPFSKNLVALPLPVLWTSEM